MIVYRICERKRGKLLTLFHGINGSRELKLNEWHTAIVKPVSDGSRKTSKIYTSGFHSLASLDECRKFSNKFYAERDLCIVECEVRGKTWPKIHSPSNIILSKYLKPLRIVETVEL